MKKVILLLCCLLLILGASACGNETAYINCLNCGASISNEASFCSKCGIALGNNQSATNNDTPDINQPSHSHVFMQATCTTPKTCSTCGATEGAANGHNWKDATCTAAKTCVVCNETSGVSHGHTTSTGICGRCNVRQGWTKDEVQSLIKVYAVFVDEINSAGGVDMKIAWENTSTKTIKYVYFTVEAYNAVDDKVYCEIRDYNEFTGYATGPFEAGYTTLLYDDWDDEYSVDVYWENCYYNSDIAYFVLTNIRIIYMDNTEENIDKDYVDYAFADIPQGLVYTWNAEYGGYEVNYRLKNDCTHTQISIPETYNNEKVVAIADNAFYEMTSLQNVDLPSTIEFIGSYAFAGCSNLLNITIPDNVTKIGSSAFHDCEKIKEITIPDGVTTISDSLLGSCANLTTIILPNGITNIGSHAFAGCDNLINIKIPDSVTTIGEGAFMSCHNLRRIVIPRRVENIEWHAFYFCPELTIYCEAPSKPETWRAMWYDYDCTVVWGY